LPSTNIPRLNGLGFLFSIDKFVFCGIM